MNPSNRFFPGKRNRARTQAARMPKGRLDGHGPARNPQAQPESLQFNIGEMKQAHQRTSKPYLAKTALASADFKNSMNAAAALALPPATAATG